MDKYKIIVLFLLLIIIFIFSCLMCSAKSLPLKNKVIFIDIGHGGNDPGAIYKDIKESDINLKIGLKLSNLLQDNGAVVYMSRYGDYNLADINAVNIKRSDLNNRIKLIKDSSCDMFLSIHLNAYTQNWYGAQSFYTLNNKDNILLANIIQEEFKKKLDTNREAKLIEDRYLYNNLNVLGVLLELGFITNSKERNLLIQDEYQYKLANVILGGIIKYYNK